MIRIQTAAEEQITPIIQVPVHLVNPAPAYVPLGILSLSSSMKLQRVFQSLLVVAWLLQLASYILPIPSWYADPAFSKIMAVDGFGSALSFDIPFLNVLPLWVYLFATVGMFFFQNWGRYLYLALWIYGWCATLLFGVRVILPLQGFLGMALGTLDGAILALIFLSPIRAAFSAVSVPSIAEE